MKQAGWNVACGVSMPRDGHDWLRERELSRSQREILGIACVLTRSNPTSSRVGLMLRPQSRLLARCTSNMPTHRRFSFKLNGGHATGTEPAPGSNSPPYSRLHVRRMPFEVSVLSGMWRQHHRNKHQRRNPCRQISAAVFEFLESYRTAATMKGGSNARLE